MDYLKVPAQDHLQFDTPHRESFFKLIAKIDNKEVVLGKGSYGIVYSAVYKSRKVAVKIIHKQDVFKLNSLKRESNILNWRNDNIVKIFKIVETIEHGAIIMECFKNAKPLQFLLDHHSGSIGLRHRLSILRDIISGLNYCHLRNLCHGDLKPLNVMVVADNNRNYICKLFDFGCSFHMDDVSKATGTARYCAPELLQGKWHEVTISAVDIFSFGIVMWQLKENEIPYSKIKFNEIVIFQVVRNNLRPDSRKNFSKENLNDHEKIAFKDKLTPNSKCKSDLFETKLNTPTNNKKLPRTTEMASKKRDKIIELHRKTNKRSRKNLFMEGLKAIDADECGEILTPKCFQHLLTDSSPYSFDKHELLDIETNYIKLYKACWQPDAAMRPSTDKVWKTIQNLLDNFEL